MIFAYKRIWPDGPPEAKQDAELRKVGFVDLGPGAANVWRDGPVKRRQARGDDQLPALTNAIAQLHPNSDDVLWIAFPEVLGHSDREAMVRLAEITRLGGTLGVASMGRTFRWHPDAADALAFLSERGGYADRQRTAPARAAAAAEREREGGEFQKHLRRVLKLWKDPDMSVKAIAEQTEHSRNTLYLWQRKGLLPPKPRSDRRRPPPTHSSPLARRPRACSESC